MYIWSSLSMYTMVFAKAMVTMASTIYHGFQLHPVHGPLNHTTRCACVPW